MTPEPINFSQNVWDWWNMVRCHVRILANISIRVSSSSR